MSCTIFFFFSVVFYGTGFFDSEFLLPLYLFPTLSSRGDLDGMSFTITFRKFTFLGSIVILSYTFTFEGPFPVIYLFMS